MTIRRFIGRFNELYSIYIPIEARKNSLKLFVFIDYLFSFVFQGASLNDYFAYSFGQLRPSGRNRYITYRRYHEIMRVCNDSTAIKVFRDKSEFNRVFEKYLGRDYIDLNASSLAEFSSFFEKHGEIFIKEVLGFRGNSVRLYSITETNPKELYDKLKSDSKGHYIAENRLKEHFALAHFHPDSVNTLRLVTVYDNINDKVHFMSARIRIGNKGNHVDNFHYDGIGANIDINTGIINSVGYNAHDEEFLFHPMTGIQIIGFQVLNWTDCLAFVENCAREVPKVRYVGWDIVPLEKGGYALIEGNDNADHDFQQMHYHGMWPEYKKLLKSLK